MKKMTWLVVLVLGMSTTAWGICSVNVRVSQPADGLPVCGDDVAVRVNVACPGECEFVKFEQSQFGSTIYVDMYLNCSCLDGPSKVSKGKWVLRDSTCGLYIVLVRVWCTYDCWPYCMFNQPMLCGMSSTYFTVCCENCLSFPCCCWMFP